jgi:hypothetical protein
VREAQLKYHEDLEEEWRRRMKEFITRHAPLMLFLKTSCLCLIGSHKS